MFSLLRYGGKANGKKPQRQKERTLEHAELKTKSQQTPVKVLRKPKPINLCVLLSGALQRNAKREARLSNISG